LKFRRRGRVLSERQPGLAARSCEHSVFHLDRAHPLPGQPDRQGRCRQYGHGPDSLCDVACNQKIASGQQGRFYGENVTMKRSSSLTSGSEVASYPKYYEHDGMLRAYANRAMALAMIFGLIAL